MWPIYIAVGAVTLIVGLLLGSAIGMAYRRKVAEKQIGSAEEQAAKIVEDAIKAAESKKKEEDFIDPFADNDVEENSSPADDDSSPWDDSDEDPFA